MTDPRSDRPEMPRADGLEVPQIEKPETPLADGLAVPQVDRPEVPQVEKPDVPQVEKPSAEVERPEGTASMPGASKGYGRLPTAPVPVEQQSGPDAEEFAAHGWTPSAQAGPTDDARLAPWALFAAIVALATSMFVGWGLPVGIVAVIAAIMTLRRPIENRGMALWALVLGLFATLFSTGWLIWAAMQFEKLG